MSALIRFKMRDGSTRDFKHEGRAGGSYTKSLTFEGNFAIVIDEYYNRTIIPAELIEIIEERDR